MTLYAKTAGGNWSAAGTWSNVSSAGVDNSGPPTAADDVVLNAGSGNVTIDSGAVCRSLNCTAYTGTLTHTAGVTLLVGDATAGAGNNALVLVAGMTYTLGNTSTSAVSFVSTSATQQTVDFGGKNCGALTFNGAAGSWILQSNITIVQSAAGSITLTTGTLDTNGKTITCGAINSSGSLTRVLTLGASAINLGNFQGTFINFATSTNLTLNAGTSTITGIGSSNSGYNFGTNLTFNNVVMTQGGGSISGTTPTFNNLTTTGVSVQSRMNLHTNITVTGTFTATGGNATSQRIFVTGGNISSGISTGIQRTITAAVASLTNVDFSDIVGAGAATWSGTSIGDVGNNSNITFTAAVTRYWVGVTGGNWSSTANWSATSGGASGASVPLAQDTVNFDANSITSGSRTIAVDVARLGKDISFAAIANTPTLAFTTSMGNNNAICAGNFTLGTLTISGTSANFSLFGRGTNTFTSAGCTFTNVVIFAGAGSTYTMQDAFASSASLQLENGTLSLGIFNVTCTTFVSQRDTTRSLICTGSQTITLTSTGTVWNITNATNFTITPASSTIKITDTSSTGITFAGGSFVYNNLWFARGVSTATNTITGTNTFADLKDDGSIAHTDTFPNVVTTVTTFSISGNAGQLITLARTGASGTFSLSKASGTVNRDYLSISNSNAIGGASWYAGANSTNGGTNKGWQFMAQDASKANFFNA